MALIIKGIGNAASRANEITPDFDAHLYNYQSSTQSGAYGIVTIPNEWFVRFFDVLSGYNFTVDENTSYDVELSIDPEMLGRIFENLLCAFIG